MTQAVSQTKPLTKQLGVLLDDIERLQAVSEKVKCNEWSFVPEIRDALASARFAIKIAESFADNEGI